METKTPEIFQTITAEFQKKYIYHFDMKKTYILTLRYNASETVLLENQI